MEWNNPVYGTTLSTGGTPARRQVLQDLGIDDGTMVVAYDNSANRWAARMVWYLRWLNHDGAALFDGGLDAWRAASGPVQSGSNSPAKRGLPHLSAHSSTMLDTPRLQARLKAGDIQLVDVRTPDEMKDDANGASKLGRIPTSISLPWTDLNANGRLKSQADLRRALDAAGISPAKPVVLYARYGVEADFPWVVLKWLGYSDVAVYDEGFVGWQTNSSRQVEPLPAS
jgi:thiosulfate/3-mercaptopyruvate sulfurtransferase